MKVVNDREVRAAFDKMLWVSVGQEPEVRELLASLLGQIQKGQTLKPELSDKEALGEVKESCKGLKVLLVLDDVWDAKYEKALNVIDADTPSKLMVTTRIRGLIKGGREVAIGTLSKADALRLLAGHGGMPDR